MLSNYNNLLKNFREKKAQIGEGISWIVAFFIIVFILLIFLLGVGLVKEQNISEGGLISLINPLSSGDGNKLDLNYLQKAVPLSEINDFINVNEIDFSKQKSDVLSSFLDKNSEIIFAWADSENKLDFSKYLDIYSGNNANLNNLNEIDLETKKLYEDVFSSYISFVKDYNLNKPYFYLRTGNKEILIEYTGKVPGEESEFSWRISNQDGKFFHNFRTDKLGVNSDPEYINRNKYFIISDKGVLIMAVFFTEEDIYKND